MFFHIQVYEGGFGAFNISRKIWCCDTSNDCAGFWYTGAQKVTTYVRKTTEQHLANMYFFPQISMRCMLLFSYSSAENILIDTKVFWQCLTQPFSSELLFTPPLLFSQYWSCQIASLFNTVTYTKCIVRYERTQSKCYALCLEVAASSTLHHSPY